MKKFMKAVAAVMLTVSMVCAAGCTKPDDPNDPNNGGNNDGGGNGGTLNGHEYVDLGLPSGTLWATCNVGANAPEKYGDFFAWGETEPKTIYDWSTYKYCNGGSDQGSDQLTKYCPESIYGNNGFTDNLTILEPGDDAATVNWGSGWRMPTHEEWVELCQNTTNTWTTLNGVNGRLFTASNGNSLFLPAAGVWSYELAEIGTRGLYWSSSLLTSFPDAAWFFDFDSGSTIHTGDGRNLGFSVRPVRAN